MGGHCIAAELCLPYQHFSTTLACYIIADTSVRVLSGPKYARDPSSLHDPFVRLLYMILPSSNSRSG